MAVKYAIAFLMAVTYAIAFLMAVTYAVALVTVAEALRCGIFSSLRVIFAHFASDIFLRKAGN
jgi:hypothetical protein